MELSIKERFDLKEKFKDYDEILEETFEDITSNYLKVGCILYEIKENQMYIDFEYSDIYEYAKERFGISATTVKNFINMYLRFGDQNCNYYNVRLKKEYENYSYSQLVELLNVDETKMIDYNPEMTVKEIRICKKFDKYSNDLITEMKKVYLEILNFKSYLSENGITLNEIDINDEFDDFDRVSYDLTLYFTFDMFGKCKDKIVISSSYNEDNINISLEIKVSNWIQYECCYFTINKIYQLNEISIEEIIKYLISEINNKKINLDNSKKVKQLKEQSDKKKLLKGKIYYSIKAVEDDGFSITDNNKLVFNLLNNTLGSIKDMPVYFKFDGSNIKLCFKDLDLSVSTYYIYVYLGNKVICITLNDIIELILNSSNQFYAIDFYNHCMKRLSPTSD